MDRFYKVEVKSQPERHDEPPLEFCYVVQANSPFEATKKVMETKVANCWTDSKLEIKAEYIGNKEYLIT